MSGPRRSERLAMTRSRTASALVLVACAVAPAAAAAAEATGPPAMLLREGWFIQASPEVRETGDVISTPGFVARDWYPATVPSTVFSALVKDRVYPDPYTGLNLRSIPGVSYPVFSNFSELPMPPDSPFRRSWWYHTEFDVPAEYRGKTLWLGFDGVNYRANVWLNGRRVASADEVAGTWRLFSLDVTGVARAGEKNALAVEVFPPQPHDLAITLVDWAPMPPDKEMGLWRDVHLAATGPVALRHPAVFTKLNLPSTDRAALTVRVELQNAADRPVEGRLEGRVDAIELSQAVRLGPKETRVVRFAPDKFPQLQLTSAKLWWPAQVGAQDLYPLDLQFLVGGEVSDSRSIRFGIREVTSEIDEKGHRVYRINGQRILVRGAGYSMDLLLRSSPERQEAQLRYVRDLNLNAIRLEGKLEDDHFLDVCDRLGILVMAGWCCCDQWEEWGKWDAEDERVAAESLRDQTRRLERHPSVFTWLNGSDFPPPPKVEEMYLRILAESDWPNPTVSSASGKSTTVGQSGMKMTGPYEYVAPSFWYLDTERGGAWGFNTETSPGPAIPPIESLRLMLPEDHLWPVDSVWEYHAGGMSDTLSVFNEALDKRYGVSSSVEEYSRKAQIQAYEAHRAMMEAYGRNKYTATGIIQWMLNNAWPSMIWHLYDWYLRPGGSYFGVKRACEPLHVQYSYDDRSIVVVNSLYRPFPGLKVTARVYDLGMTERLAREATIDVAPDSSTRVFTLPEVDGLSSTYFVSLRLESAAELVSRNFYWLSTRPETLDWARSDRDESGQYQISTWTPTKTFADYTALATLPNVELVAAARSERGESESSTTVTLRNPSRALAFGIRLKVDRASSGRVGRHVSSDDEVLPVRWEDNYLALLPGEARQVTATYATKDLRGSAPAVEVEGWNVNTTRIQP
jgi:exo-1,4-beta-D-glucosaminidase